MKFIESPTRNLFFTGKGGVGKTSMASATAIALADQGKTVLLVSTDPASNLDEVLGTKLSSQPTAVSLVSNLWAMNIDPEQAAKEYRERMVAPYRGVLPDAAVQSMEEQFSGSCTLEIAAFDEFAKILGDPNATSEFDHVIFDTAPTGHTLRLLTLPSAWTGFIETNASGTSCLGPLAGLQTQQALYKTTVRALADPQQTTLILVTRPETSAFREAERTSGELKKLGVENQHLIVNGAFTATETDDAIANAMESRCASAMTNMPFGLAQLQQTIVPLSPASLVGVASLRNLGCDTARPHSLASAVSSGELAVVPNLLPMHRLLDELADAGRGVILTMGKGGVGKTSVAAGVAVALAEKGFKVHLTTTDPAAHLTFALAEEELAGLSVSRIDPAEVTAAYRDEVMRTAGADLDAAGRALLEEDLRSPCTEEIAVFRAFAKAVAEGEDGFVVLDTAPTGHTILLLDAALAYHREVSRQASEMPEYVEKLLPRLRAPDFTRILVVTLPESTPVHEAAKLQQDLERAEIEPFAWVINQALSPHTLRDPVLAGRQSSERPLIHEVASQYARRTAIIPWLVDAPAGLKGLRKLIEARSEQREAGASMAEAQSIALYPEIAKFLEARKREFNQILDSRKDELEQLADYIRESLESSGIAKLTFICTHNSRRSHLSQIWAKVAADAVGLPSVATYSGGTEATAMNPRVVDSLKRCGLRIEAESPHSPNPHYRVHYSPEIPPLECYSKVHDATPNPATAYCAIMTCSSADEACPIVPGCELRLPIRYQDPKAADDTPQERATYDERSRQIGREMLYSMLQV